MAWTLKPKEAWWTSVDPLTPCCGAVVRPHRVVGGVGVPGVMVGVATVWPYRGARGTGPVPTYHPPVPNFYYWKEWSKPRSIAAFIDKTENYRYFMKNTENTTFRVIERTNWPASSPLTGLWPVSEMMRHFLTHSSESARVVIGRDMSMGKSLQNVFPLAGQ